MLTWISVQNDSLSCETCIEGMSVRRQFLYIDLLSLNSVRSFCSVCPVSPIATGSIVASYST